MAETTTTMELSCGNRGMQGPLVAVCSGCVVARRGSIQIYYKVTNLCYNLSRGCAESYVSNPVPGVLAVTKITYFLYTSAA